jgi:hypothetical protein
VHETAVEPDEEAVKLDWSSDLCCKVHLSKVVAISAQWFRNGGRCDGNEDRSDSQDDARRDSLHVSESRDLGSEILTC